MTVRDVYNRVCSRWLEPGQLRSGLVTDQDFLYYFSDVISDFFERTGIVKLIVGQAINFSVPSYEIPDQISHVETLFVSGRILRRTDLDALNMGVYQWRKKTGMPQQYFENGLPIKQVELYPAPNYQGQAIPVPPSPNVFTSPETNNYFIVGDFYPQWRDLTLVGVQVPLNPDLTVKTSWGLDDPITSIPNSAGQYLAWGCLAKMFGSDSEAKDEGRAKYCSARYEEGISLFRAIDCEKCLNDPDASL